ncbi:uncharacterized protein CXorf65 homolog [Asterias rubens]|uniref:uncharacterized protein CXorf65 homolog n=1 Tax=Asterias rubens TaxID=7604 RepID=UPI00145523CE|nr:uncharacterized protein CXorf65 homolog [Asterias rubens]
MFVSVWLGGNNIFLVNNDCMVQNVVQYLRKKCGITDKKVTLDLADEDGNLQNLMDYNPRFPAARILQPKVTYVPILMEKNEDNTWKPFRPMVNRVLKDADFMRQLTEQYERRELSRTGQRVRLESVQEAEKDVAVPTGKGAGKGALSTPKKGAGGGRSKTTK